MLDVDSQKRLLDALVAAAKEEGCLVAPVGSLYFLFQGAARAHTKDIDAVIHDAELRTVDLQVLERIARRLGNHIVTLDHAVVQIRTRADQEDPDVELIRGRSTSKGFVPRPLLDEAAKAARRDGILLHYPVEYVLVLKADAAIDREERAARNPKFKDENLRRANAFQSDVFAEVNRALLNKGLNSLLLRSAISHLKKNRQEAVTALLRAAGAPA